MELIDGVVMVEWSDIGEGLSGDYDEEDPTDIPLLRFYVRQQAVEACEAGATWWEDVEDASYCTNMPVGTPANVQRRALRHILQAVKADVEAGRSIKKKCERLSWIGSDWVPARIYG